MVIRRFPSVSRTTSAQGGIGFVRKTIGPPGSNYPIAAYNNDLGAAVLQFLKDSNTSNTNNGYYFRGIILAGKYTPSTRIQIPAGTQYVWLEGEGEGVTIIQPPKNSGAGNNLGPAWIGTDSLSTPLLYHFDKITFDGTLQNASPPAATAWAFTSGVAYIHGTSGATPAATRALVQFVGINAANISACSFTPSGGGATDLKTAFGANLLAQILSSGYPMNKGDSITLTDATDTLTTQYQYTNEFVEITTQDWQLGAEKSAQVDFENIEGTGVLHVGVAGIGSQVGVNAWAFAFRGCEDSHYKFGKLRSASATAFPGYLIECYNGSFHLDGSNFGQLAVCGNSPLGVGVEVGNGGVVITGNGPAATQVYTLIPKYANGSSSTTGVGNVHVNAQCALPANGNFLINVNFVGGSWVRQANSGTTDAFVTAATAAELKQVACDMMGPTFTGCSATTVLARTTGGTASQLASIQGSFQISGSATIATFTAQFILNCNVTVSKTSTVVLGPAPAQQVSIASPTALSLTTTAAQMLGLNLAVMPRISGTIRVGITARINSNTAADGATWQLRRGGFPAGTPTLTTDNGATLTVSVGFSQASGFIILVDSEVMLVTGGGTGTTWNVTRAQSGTQQVTHAGAGQAIGIGTVNAQTGNPGSAIGSQHGIDQFVANSKNMMLEVYAIDTGRVVGTPINYDLQIANAATGTTTMTVTNVDAVIEESLTA